MKFSIIIATFNPEANSLSRTLDSLKNQTYDTSQFEIIIVDGGSTNGTTELIEQYKQQLSCQLHYCSEPDKGIYDAFNKGVKKAKGLYINFKGAGDWIEPHALSEIALAAESYDYDMIYCYLQYWKVSADGDLIKSYLHKNAKEPILYHDPLHPRLFYKRALHNLYGFYSMHGRIASDWVFFFEVSFNPSFTRTVVPIILAHFVLDGISSTNLPSAFIETIELSSDILQKKWSQLSLYEQKHRYIGLLVYSIEAMTNELLTRSLITDSAKKTIFWNSFLPIHQLWFSTFHDQTYLTEAVYIRLEISQNQQEFAKFLLPALLNAFNKENSDLFWPALEQKISSPVVPTRKMSLKKFVKMLLPYGVVRCIHLLKRRFTYKH